MCCQTKHPCDIELSQVWNNSCWNLEGLKANCSRVCFFWLILRFIHMAPHFWALSELSEPFPNSLFMSILAFCSDAVNTFVHVAYPMTSWHVQERQSQESMVAANWIAATKWRSLPWLTAERGTTERWRVAERRLWLVLDIILPHQNCRWLQDNGRNVSDRCLTAAYSTY